uniref:translation initiation factor IF-2-like n=1 Tax=Scatophagus argus TaxID=75038 RepID=UPI001ED8455B|nr:translation initiation factor IF-2-like [Scatophagus argus]
MPLFFLPAYGSNGYNGYGAQPMGGYTGGYGSAGLGLGPRYGNGGMKGPKQGYGYPSGGATKPEKPGYGNVPNRYGAKPNGYGAIKGGAVRPQPANGKGAVPTAHGTKPNGYGAAPGTGAGLPKGHGTKPNGHAVRNGAALGGYGGYRGTSKDSKPQFTKGVGAVSPSEGTETLGTGYGMMPNGKSAKAVGAFNGKGLKGQVLSPEQPSAAPEQGVTPQQATTQGAAPVAPEPTSGILVMVTHEKYHKLPSPVPQTTSYKQTPLIPQAIPEPAPAAPEEPNPAPEPTPEPAQINPAPEPAAVLPQGKCPKRESVLYFCSRKKD